MNASPPVQLKQYEVDVLNKWAAVAANLAIFPAPKPDPYEVDFSQCALAQRHPRVGYVVLVR